MPMERRKKTKTPENIPGAGPDRKRVLNVLAQRRYRQRQREKIAALEAQARGLTSIQTFDQGHDEGSASDGSAQALDLQTLQGANYVPILDGPLEHETIGDHTIVLTGDESQIVEDAVRQSSASELLGTTMGEQPFDMELFGNLYPSCFPNPNPTSPVSSSSALTEASSASEPSLNFPLSADGAQLEVPILSALQTFTKISSMLNLLNNIWNPDYQHILSPIPSPNLPPNFLPTLAQMTIPHHPFLDALPWPSVREKLICMLAMPSAFRPAIAQDEDAASQGQGKAIMRLVQDMDDFRGHVRVHGNMSGWGNENELVEEAWEVGECFYRNWWWCLDEKVIRTANKRRRERGERSLRMQ